MKNKLMIPMLALPVLLAAVLAACTKTKGDAYKDYMQGGEMVYPGRVDTVISQAGNGRVQLVVVLGNDPLVTQMRVYWNNRQDSLNVPVDHTKDTLKVMIPNLTEGNYNFVIYTLDAQGHRSVDYTASGTVYGGSYLSSLVNRTLQSVTLSKNGLQALLTWKEVPAGELGVEVNYTGQDGSVRRIIAPVTETVTALPDYKELTQLTFHSLYRPDSTAFEDFSPPYVEVTLPAFERQLDKSRFALVNLPTDVQEGGYGWLQKYMWDENYNPPGFATRNQVPCWFTFDAGESVPVSHFVMWQANDRLFQKESIKNFELYGSNSPDADGGWNNWTKIGDVYTSVKPSGLPVGQNSQADMDYARAGEVFNAPAGAAAFRYYRFKLLTNWGGSSFMTLEEITFYTRAK